MMCVSSAISSGMDISEVAGCYDRCVLSEHHKNNFRIGVPWTQDLLLCFSPIFNSMNYGLIKKDVNQITLNCTILQNLVLQIFKAFSHSFCSFCWIWIFLWIKLWRYSCSMWDKLGWFSWFWQFLCEGLSSFKTKGFCYSYAWPCSFCEGRISFCIRHNPADFYLYFQLASLHSESYFFFLYQPPSSSCSFWCYFINEGYMNIDKVLSINPSVNVLSLETLTSIIRTGLSILVELIDMVNCYNFSISNDLTRVENFPT